MNSDYTQIHQILQELLRQPPEYLIGNGAAIFTRSIMGYLLYHKKIFQDRQFFRAKAPPWKEALAGADVRPVPTILTVGLKQGRTSIHPHGCVCASWGAYAPDPESPGCFLYFAPIKKESVTAATLSCL